MKLLDCLLTVAVSAGTSFIVTHFLQGGERIPSRLQDQRHCTSSLSIG